MTRPIPANLRDLTREDLIELILQQAEDIRRLQEEVAALKKPTTTSRNSSQPPSRDWKSDRPTRKSRKRQGPPPGHVKAERPLVEKPDKVIDVPVTVCTNCGTDLSAVAPQRTLRQLVHTGTEIGRARV